MCPTGLVMVIFFHKLFTLDLRCFFSSFFKALHPVDIKNQVTSLLLELTNGRFGFVCLGFVVEWLELPTGWTGLRTI